METSFFEPTDEYLTAAVNVPSVVKVLEKQEYKKPLFMITGVKVVNGASKAVSTKKPLHEIYVMDASDRTLQTSPMVSTFGTLICSFETLTCSRYGRPAAPSMTTTVMDVCGCSGPVTDSTG